MSDWADKAARKALQNFRRGSQISGGCVEIYPAVAAALRQAAHEAAAMAYKDAKKIADQKKG